MNTNLMIYYQKIFPTLDICNWLSYKNDIALRYREFSIKLSKGLYLRYLSFQSPNDLQKTILKECPLAINVGAVYKTPPDNKIINRVFVEKELVFDIDISDYDDVRTCCESFNICKKCWKYIVIACKILNMHLDHHFGFNKLLWIFSGRRGIHCWVNDKAARTLNQEARHALINFMKHKKLKFKNQQFFIRKLNYYDRCILSFIEPEFVQLCIVDQNLLGTEKGVKYFLDLLPDKALTDVEQLFNDHTSSIDRWNSFIEYHNKMINDSKVEYWKGMEEYPDYVKLYYCSPIFDFNVTKDEKHLLRCPFSVHHVTHKIVVPFDVAKIEEFDPSSSPTVEQVVNEIIQYQSENYTINYDETSLKYPIIIFRNFLEQIVSEKK